ncbi:hypothetical protein [Umezakia ovalisporum]|jgi:putative transposase|uniref:Uncharacterized protein n=2 Tax=Umezakia ovalisporum TaxID=75695 RepID=A0AA43KEG6_9CYAN|nr:hypothetical protein [Umezakia ovalisporum]MDH6056039.1 hypothetical protein [Umezakia ovalisporum FSS-43]MDH6063417.1 hypothetical protein [Umezakia ovalisporum FSS-62]MDH6065716.1 hypothetical protein [Umezakia ovalisporum APH033B]MDH6069925.1 hypothetical protein [Umezakia ovalisporum CobakiLakeA]MDH6075225.1 hypothetical protein [Umezakia ovalisporum CS-1034]
MAKDFTQLKKLPDYEWLQEPTAAVLQQSLKNLESPFKNFFAKGARFPKFKSQHSHHSMGFPESCSIKGGGLKLHCFALTGRLSRNPDNTNYLG